MKLIVGLGNPEERYAGTRHNLGFDVLEEYARKSLTASDYNNFWIFENKFKAEIGKIPEKDLTLVRPQTFMNKSGLAVRAITNYYKLQTTNLIVVHDDLDLPLGKLKVRLGGASAGHHGVESVIDNLKTDQFIRIRLGIGNLRTQSSERNGQHLSAEKFVLEPFIHSEKSKIKHMIKQALKALDLLLEKGITEAQNQYN